MSEWGLSDKGFARPSFDDILSERVKLAKELFGEDIKTGNDYAVGKHLRIGAYADAKSYETMELVYYARYPESASGVSLDRLCVYVGIQRNPATKARHKVTVTGTPEAVIPAGFAVGVSTRDIENALVFQSVEDAEIDTDGTGVLEVECTQAGLVGNVGEDEIAAIINPSADVSAITGSEILLYGADAESDAELRRRISLATEGAGSANADAIRAAILRVPTVISAGLIENDTSETDSAGRPPHSFECFVYGGDTDEYEQMIAEAIFSKKPVGVKSVSTSDEPVSVQVYDDGGYAHTVVFSHTETVSVKCKIQIKTDAEFEETGIEQIQKNMVSYIDGLGVGAEVVLSSLYGHIHAVEGVVDVPYLALSSDGGSSYKEENVAVEAWQVAKTTADDISIEVVT